jgi:Mor family transcriptional regulator
VWREKRFPTVFPIGAGEKNGRARLNESLVRKMRKDRDVGKKVSELSEEYGVSESTVREILSKNLWKHC